MQPRKQRIFIKNLPETATEDEIKLIFSNYGQIQSIEIKERPSSNVNTLSLFFAFINIEIDDYHLNKCFKDFQNEEWHGKYVQLEVAKESFLEKLRREREENKNDFHTAPVVSEYVEAVKVKEVLKPNNEEANLLSEKSSSDETSESDEESPTPIQKPDKKTKIFKHEDPKLEEVSEMVIKSNKHKTIDKNGLKIESVGKPPILVIERKKKPQAGNALSLLSVTKNIQLQKSTIKAALANFDSNRSHKIVFDKSTQKIAKSKPLFNDKDQSDEDIYDFEIKSQFEGEKGQQLLELQSKYKNDERFRLDRRFDNNVAETAETSKYDLEEKDMSFEEERKKEFEILEQVLGTEIKMSNGIEKQQKEFTKVGGMVRYDPSLPVHSKYEIQFNKKLNEKQKRKLEQKVAQQPEPDVSKEVFYQVNENLKNTLQEGEGFSLLKMFGRDEIENEPENNEESMQSLNKSRKMLNGERNPFRYDSTDDEQENTTVEDNKKNEESSKPVKMWTEPFFFVEDDFRFKEGLDFIFKIAKTCTGENFGSLRREIKQVVRTKVKNCLKRNKLFKKKIGGKGRNERSKNYLKSKMSMNR